MHKVLVNHLGGLSLPRKSVVRLTDHPDMTLDVYRGCITTKQQKQQTFVSQLFRKDRIFSAERKEVGGGIIVYVKNDVKVERRSDIELDEIECLLLEVFPK